ncbi:MAG: acetylxylan esterase [Bacteroidota bacterium]|nr:acetylxylan esterase [Bacteroidota bacterium]
MKNLFALTCLLLFSTGLFAQTADEQYKKPLKELLDEIQTGFKVKLKYPEDLVKDKILNYAEWRIRSYNLEQTLTNILSPFDMSFTKEYENVYKIKPFEYARRTPEEGKAQLAYFSTLYNDRLSWEARKQALRECMISALGLNPMPKSPGTKPIVTPQRVMNGYTVQNVAIETLPGLYVCGSLYRPIKPKGLCPIILNPDGHFQDGRYRADCQYRCALLARMGAIAFSYDLFAWGESRLQFKDEDHRRSIANTIHNLNGIRILDYLTTLKGADTSRIAITGASGGGSQTMQLTAIDNRIKVSVPVVMVSSYFFGGCPCESGMPFQLCLGGTNNAEIAAMAAPRPMMIISDGKDWTANVPELEFPFIQRTYSFYGKKDLVENAHFPKEGHDYGSSKRMAMYVFMAKQLGLDLNAVKNKDDEIDESTVTIEKYPALYVFGKNGELLPSNAIKNIDQLYKVFEEEKAKQE